MFLSDLQDYLTVHGYADIYRDNMPDQPNECIGLFLTAHTVPPISDGSASRYVQIRVRRLDGDDAYTTAYSIFKLLDSGLNEDVIQLTEQRAVIARPHAGPVKLVTNESGYTIYFTEIVLIGDDNP